MIQMLAATAMWLPVHCSLLQVLALQVYLYPRWSSSTAAWWLLTRRSLFVVTVISITGIFVPSMIYLYYGTMIACSIFTVPCYRYWHRGCTRVRSDPAVLRRGDRLGNILPVRLHVTWASVDPVRGLRVPLVQVSQQQHGDDSQQHGIQLQWDSALLFSRALE